MSDTGAAVPLQPRGRELDRLLARIIVPTVDLDRAACALEDAAPDHDEALLFLLAWRHVEIVQERFEAVLFEAAKLDQAPRLARLREAA